MTASHDRDYICDKIIYVFNLRLYIRRTYMMVCQKKKINKKKMIRRGPRGIADDHARTTITRTHNIGTNKQEIKCGKFAQNFFGSNKIARWMRRAGCVKHFTTICEFCFIYYIYLRKCKIVCGIDCYCVAYDYNYIISTYRASKVYANM